MFLDFSEWKTFVGVIAEELKRGIGQITLGLDEGNGGKTEW
jgi:hypothetical protein